MEFCKKCGSENSDDALFCAKCGQPLKDQISFAPKPKRKTIGCLTLIVLSIILGVILAKCNSGPAQYKASVPTTISNTAAIPTSQPKPTFEVIDIKGTTDSNGGTITGTVRNNSTKQYGYVQIEINLYDNTGAQVGSTLANVNNLEAGGTWKFEAVTFTKFTKYKVKDITGF
jgi:hypothetical protein